jgi:hypothetical protein
MREYPRIGALLAIGLCLVGCDRSGFTDVICHGAGCPGESLGCAPAAEVRVDPLYPQNGADWNDYVTVSAPSATAFAQADQPCLGTELGYARCVHGGEKRRVALPEESSCIGLVGRDDLGAFEWFCDASGSEVVMLSRGLAEDRGLKDLLASSSSFADNAVHVTRDGCTLAESAPEVWWANSVVPAPANPSPTDVGVELTAAGTIYVVDTDTSSSGYILAEDRVALVTLPGVTLAWSGRGSGFCDGNTGEYLDGGSPYQLCAGQRDFVWIEGSFDAAGTTKAALFASLIGTRFLRVHGVSAVNAGLLVLGAQSAWIDDVRIGMNKIPNETAFELGSSTFSTLHRVRVGGGVTPGLVVYQSDHNVLSQLTVSDNQNDGINLLDNGGQSRANVLSQVVALNAEAILIQGFFNGGTGCVETTVHHLTVANGVGVSLGAATQTTLVGLALVNNVAGLTLGSADDSVIIDAVTDSVSVTSTDGADFQGMLMVPSTSDCQVSGGSNVYLDPATCAHGGPGMGTPALVQPSLAATFVGKTADTSNGSADGSGTAPYATLEAPTADYVNFEHWMRGWGRGGSDFPDGSNVRWCDGGTCQIYDLSLRAGDTVLRAEHGTLEDGATCPASVDASVASNVVTDFAGRIFLKNAIELMGDGVGDDNTLCESNEACLFAPNLGAYQGHGNPRGRSCELNGGNGVISVQLLGFSANGR